MQSAYDTQYMGWFERSARTAVFKDEMKLSERLGELAGITVTFLFALFFVAHQLWGTGFFTENFGSFETALFYAAIAFGIVTGASRAVLGRRNEIRPLDIAGYVLGAVSCFWFFTVFPFDFTHFGDVIPFSLGFLISWIPALLVKVFLVIGCVGATAGAVYVSLLYLRVRMLLASYNRSETWKQMRTPFHH